MKKIIIVPINWLNQLFFPEFMKKQKGFNPLLIFKFGIIQKIFGINRCARWPVHWTSQIISPEKIDFGDRAPGLSISCFIDGRNRIELGENVWIGPRVSLISQNHDNYDYHKYTSTNPIKIGNNCLLTANCVILPGVELGDNTIVAAGAIVSKSFPEGKVVLAGMPAKIIKVL